MDKVYCILCGQENPANAAFCNQCGAPLKKPGEQPMEQPVQQAYQQPYRQPYQQPYQLPYQPYQQPYGYPNQPPVAYAQPKIPGRGFGIAAMVLGIIGLIYAFAFLGGAVEELEYYQEYMYYEADYYDIGFSDIMGLIMISAMPVLGIIFGLCARRRGYRNGVSTSGLVLGTIGMVFILTAVIVYLSI